MGIRTKDLSKIGYTDNVARSLAIMITGKNYKHDTKEQIMAILADVLEYPGKYKENEIWGPLAEHFSPTVMAKAFDTFDLLEEPLMYKTYGGKYIESIAKQQMGLAMRLPVTLAGALMPDAHAGYGLPIGGSIEEMPLAYKDIDRVMRTQDELVEIQGRFMPHIVRMNKE